MRFPAFILFCSILLLHSNIFAQFFSLEQEAFSYAKDTHRPVLLVFAGSDWCVPCIRFEKEILSDSSFRDFAKENLVILKAEFPQRKKLPQDIVAQNEGLAEHYNPSGLFPNILLLQEDGLVLHTFNYQRQTAAEFTAEIRKVVPDKQTLREYHTKTRLMGCSFEFTIVDSTGSERAWNLIRQSIDEVQRIERLISEWSDTTQVGRLNKNAGVAPSLVSSEVIELVQRSIAISDLTQGAFDITFGGVGKLWKFDPADPVIPDSNKIALALKSVGYQKIQVSDPGSVFLSEPGMQIGFGGIGKGYAAEQVKQMLISNGISSGVVNASGDLTAWGQRADGTPWRVGIADPDDPEKVLLWLPVKDASVATSGNYEKYVMINGERYGHIIDPRTGYPVKGIKSATVISPSAELSDALATAVFVMGVENGLFFIEQIPGVHCIIINDKNEVFYSESMNPPGDKGSMDKQE